MILIELVESREKCTEAGWLAYDFCMDSPIEKDTILLFRPYGSFLYLDMLKEPFYKIESDNYIIKGIAGKKEFRVAVHNEHTEIIKTLEELFL